MSDATTEPQELDDIETQFVAEYLVDKNASAAALRCGAPFRSRRERGRELSHRPHVREAIKKGIQEQAERTGITADRVMREMGYLAFSDIREIRINDDGTLDCTTATGRAIQEIQMDRKTRTLEDGTVEIRIKAKVKLYNKHQSVTTLMQHLGLITNEKPNLEVFLNLLPEKSATILRKLIINPALMPKPAIADTQPKPETVNVENPPAPE